MWLRSWPTLLPTLLTPAASGDAVSRVAAMLGDLHPAGMRAALRAFGPADLRTVLGAISVPTLLLYGEADRRSPLRVGEDLHARIPGSALVVIPCAPQLVSLEQPDAFNQAVRAFAKDIGERSGA